MQDRVRVLDGLYHLQDILGTDIQPVHTDPRPGDIRASCADGSKARRDLGFSCDVSFREGLQHTVEWYLRWRDRPSTKAS